MRLRHLRVLGIAFSSLALLITGLLWCYSQDTRDECVWNKTTVALPTYQVQSRGVGVGRGSLFLWKGDSSFETSGTFAETISGSGWVLERQRSPATELLRPLPWHGFKYDTWSMSVGGVLQTRQSTLWIPLWLLAVIFSAYPLFAWIRSTRTADRVATGRCPQCGYDLRASPERCPECGRVARTLTESIC
jgi:hypothetical protein